MKNNVPVFQTKEHINSPWSPHEGVCIWKEDTISKQLQFPSGEPKSKVLAPMYKRAEDVLPYITHYVECLKKTWKDETSSGYVERLPLIEYWRNIAEISCQIHCQTKARHLNHWKMDFGHALIMAQGIKQSLAHLRKLVGGLHLIWLGLRMSSRTRF